MRTATVALLGALLLAGCGSSPTDSGSSTSEPAGSTTTVPTSPNGDPSPTEPPRTIKPGRSRHITATGTAKVNDIEGGGCITMVLEGQAYSLVGRLDGLRDGRRATVTGYADPTSVTTCQGGPVFVVEKVSPATS